MNTIKRIISFIIALLTALSFIQFSFANNDDSLRINSLLQGFTDNRLFEENCKTEFSPVHNKDELKIYSNESFSETVLESGLFIDDFEYSSAVEKNTGKNCPNASPIPSKYDARDENTITSVKNQGMYSNCWAYATMSCLESDAVKNYGFNVKTTDFSESHLSEFVSGTVDTKHSDFFYKTDYRILFSNSIEGNLNCWDYYFETDNTLDFLIRFAFNMNDGKLYYRENNEAYKLISNKPLRDYYDCFLFEGNKLYYYYNSKSANVYGSVEVSQHDSPDIYAQSNKVFFETAEGERFLLGKIEKQGSFFYYIDDKSGAKIEVSSNYYNNNIYVSNEYNNNTADLILFFMREEGFFYPIKSGRGPLDGFSSGGNPFLATYTLSTFTGIANEKKNYTQNRYDSDSGLIIGNCEYLRSETDVKSWILTHGSACVSINSNSEYCNENTIYCYEKNVTNHEVSVIGWDDNFSADSFVKKADRNGAWLVKNSWGTDVGDKGFFWVSYADKSENNFYGLTVKNRNKFNDVYSHCGIMAQNDETINNGFTVANVYRFENNEQISAVGVWLLYGKGDSQVRIRVYSYNDGSNDRIITAGSSALVDYTYEFDRCGYHTVELPEKPFVKAGKKYVIALTYTATGGSVIIPSEKAGSENSSLHDNYFASYALKSGESYYTTAKNLSGASWTDSVNDYGNFYINALTSSPNNTDTEIHFTSSTVNLTVEEGETASVKISYINSIYSPSLTYYDYDGDIITPSLSNKWSNESNNKVTDLIIKGNKTGTTSIKVKAYDPDTGFEFGVVKIDVIVMKTTPAVSNASVIIRGFSSDFTADYKSSFKFNAVAENMPANAEIMWYMNGKFSGIKGSSFSAQNITSDFTVKAVIAQKGKALASSQEISVHIKGGFFAALIAFFRGLFGSLPYIEDGVKK